MFLELGLARLRSDKKRVWTCFNSASSVAVSVFSAWACFGKDPNQKLKVPLRDSYNEKLEKVDAKEKEMVDDQWPMATCYTFLRIKFDEQSHKLPNLFLTQVPSYSKLKRFSSTKLKSASKSRAGFSFLTQNGLNSKYSPKTRHFSLCE